MFNFFKKGNKDKETDINSTGLAESETPWGVPVKRKMSRKEEAAEAAEQAAVEQRNLERRDMYRLPGSERIIQDVQGRRLALRIEENTGPQPIAGHPGLMLLVFWGARELSHIKAEMDNGVVTLVECRTEGGYEGWGLPAQLLQEIEQLARTKGAKELRASIPPNQKDWDNPIFAQSGYQAQGTELIKPL